MERGPATGAGGEAPVPAQPHCFLSAQAAQGQTEGSALLTVASAQGQGKGRGVCAGTGGIVSQSQTAREQGLHQAWASPGSPAPCVPNPG